MICMQIERYYCSASFKSPGRNFKVRIFCFVFISAQQAFHNFFEVSHVEQEQFAHECLPILLLPWFKLCFAGVYLLLKPDSLEVTTDLKQTSCASVHRGYVPIWEWLTDPFSATRPESSDLMTGRPNLHNVPTPCSGTRPVYPARARVLLLKYTFLKNL